MKKNVLMFILALASTFTFTISCCNNKGACEREQSESCSDSVEQEQTQAKALAEEAQSSDVPTKETQRALTADMAYEGVNNYCHSAYDWSAAKDDPDIMNVTMGEETEAAYQVIFRSYTGSFVHFFVDKKSGKTQMIEKVPSLNIEEEAGSINIYDYL